MLIRLIIAASITLMSAPVFAQHHATASYADLTSRPIKALSDEQVVQFREGRGMGLSLPAELNSYPGPVHVLEMRDALVLTAEQETKIQMVYEAMITEAKALGQRIIAAESRLDNLFSTTSAKPDEVTALLDEIAGLNGRLRSTHILAHMETRAVLDHRQVVRYNRERGYEVSSNTPKPHRH